MRDTYTDEEPVPQHVPYTLSSSSDMCCPNHYLLRLILLLLFEDVGEVYELLHGLYLPAEVF